MIHLYDFDNTDYEKNGDYDLSNIVVDDDYYSGNINEIPTYKFSVTIEDNELWKQIVENKIIKTETPYGDDLFRIEETEVSSDDYILDVYTKQIFSDCSKTLAKDTSNDNIYICETGNVNGQGALNKLFNGTKFKGHSNITSIYNTRWERKTIAEALIGDADNSFINKYGGELFVKKFDVTVNDKIGSDNGVEILYGKNIENISKNVDMTSVITRIVPIGYNGLRLTGKTPWVDSPLINKYPIINEQVIEFSNVKVKENENDDGFATEEDARKELIRLSKLMFSEQNIDTPSVNIKINMVDLTETEEYKNYKQLETVLKGDIIHCRHSKLNITTDARCLNFHYSAKSKKIISIEIGDVTESYFQNQIDLSKKLENILDGNTVKANMVAGLINGLQTKFHAQYDVAQKQHVRAMLFEDLDPNSPNYGAVCIGSMGIEIASKRTADGRAWDWKTFITGGLVRADYLIGILTNADGSLKLDLSGTDGAKFFNNDELAIRIYGSRIDFYNFMKRDELIGSIGCSVRRKDDGTWLPNRPLITMWNEPNSMLDIGYKGKDGKVYPYMRFDEYDIENECATSPITVRRNMGFLGYANLNFYGNDWNIPLGTICLNTANDMSIMCGEHWKLKLGYMSGDGKNFTNMVVINKDGFKAYGDKQCVQKTEYYGDVGFSATEDISALLTWTMRNIEIKEKDKAEDGYYYKTIYIPNIIKETINVEKDYTVYITKIHTHKDCSLWEMDKNKFIVCSEEPCLFSFKLEGDRKGFEFRGLAEMEESGKNFRKEQQKIAGDSWIDYGRCYEG